MANILEKKLSVGVRTRLQTLIAAALGIFLGLRYNDFFSTVIEKYIPVSEGLGGRFLILIGLTIGIVYFSAYLEKFLGGK